MFFFRSLIAGKYTFALSAHAHTLHFDLHFTLWMCLVSFGIFVVDRNYIFFAFVLRPACNVVIFSRTYTIDTKQADGLHSICNKHACKRYMYRARYVGITITISYSVPLDVLTLSLTPSIRLSFPFLSSGHNSRVVFDGLRVSERNRDMYVAPHIGFGVSQRGGAFAKMISVFCVFYCFVLRL